MIRFDEPNADVKLMWWKLDETNDAKDILENRNG